MTVFVPWFKSAKTAFLAHAEILGMFSRLELAKQEATRTITQEGGCAVITEHQLNRAGGGQIVWESSWEASKEQP